MDQALSPRSLLPHLTQDAPWATDPRYKRWIVEEQIIRSWLLDSMNTDYFQKFIEYRTAKAIWEAVHKFYSKKNDSSEISSLVNRANSLQQGDKTVMAYANELSSIYNELDFYRPPQYNSLQWEYTVQDRIYHFLEGLRPEFEGLRSQIYNRGVHESFDDAIAAVVREEGRLQQMKVNPESLAFVSHQGGKSQPFSFPPRGQDKGQEKQWKDGPFCNYCKRRGHTKDKCWKLRGRPPQPPYLGQTHIVEGSDQQGSQNRTSSQAMVQEVQRLVREEMQQLKNLLTSGGSVMGSTSLAGSGNLNLSNFLSDFLALSVSNNSIKEAWILDSGATDHMTPNKENFMRFNPIDKGRYVKTADGTLLPVMGIGTIKLDPIGLLTQVLYIPKLFVSLVSVQRLAKNKEYNILFDDLNAFLCNKVLGWRIGLARVQQGLYFLPWVASREGRKVEHQVVAISSNFEGEIMRIHQRMGHPSFDIVKMMYPQLFRKVVFENLMCEACQLGKKKRSTYQVSNLRCNEPFHLIHCDMWGPSPTTDIEGFKYFLICVDDYSRKTWGFLLKQKSDATKTFKIFCTMVRKQFGTEIKGFRTDNAKDFCNNELKEFFEYHGIRHETSCPYTPQQNGLAERKIGDVMNKCRTLMIAANIPRTLWGFSVLTDVYLINRVPSKGLNFKTPNELIEAKVPRTQKKENIKPKVFGCVGYVLSHDVNRDKLSPRAHKCVFVGYSNTQKGYKLYHPTTKRVFVSKDVTFNENTYFYSLQPDNKDLDLFDLSLEKENDTTPLTLGYTDEIRSEQGISTEERPKLDPISTVDSDKGLETPPEGEHQFQPYPKFYERKKKHNKELIQNETLKPNVPREESSPTDCTIDDSNSEKIETRVIDSGKENNDDLPIAIRKGTRSCVQNRVYDMVNYLDYQKVSPNYKCFLTTIKEIGTPRNPQEALKNSSWKQAMDDEMAALIENQTWEIVELPSEKKPVGCRWVYTIKCNSDGSLERYKARLVAKGYTQTYGIDYQETFAPVAKMNTIRVLISLAVNLDWELFQYDIKNAFLYGELKEEIYMQVPPGYEKESTKGKVCRLKKAIYGLKQSPRAWFGKFSHVLKSFGYRQCNGDHTLFFQHFPQGGVVLLIVYVDDIIITGNRPVEIKELEVQLSKQFTVKSLGPLKYFLGMEFA